MSAAVVMGGAAMRAHRLTMSKMALAYECLYGFRADAEQTPRPPGREARIGTFFHSLIEAHVNGMSLEHEGDEELVSEARALFSKPLQSYLDSIPWTACEIGLVYDAGSDSARVGPRRGEPGYGEVGPMELAGTLDLVAVTPDDALVLDAKSGKLVRDKNQLYAQAVAVSRRYGVSSVRVGYLYGRKTKCDPPEVETLDADRLDLEAGRISRALRKLPVAAPAPGDYCWKCDARPGCPAFQEQRGGDDEKSLEEAGFFA